MEIWIGMKNRDFTLATLLDIKGTFNHILPSYQGVSSSRYDRKVVYRSRLPIRRTFYQVFRALWLIEPPPPSPSLERILEDSIIGSFRISFLFLRVLEYLDCKPKFIILETIYIIAKTRLSQVGWIGLHHEESPLPRVLS